MITKIEGTCAYEGCNKPATMIACGRSQSYDKERKGHPTPACYCDRHAHQVANEYEPEYIDNCPNCDCCFGVN